MGCSPSFISSLFGGAGPGAAIQQGAWKQVVSEQYRFLAAEGVPPVPQPQAAERHESPASPRTQDAKRASFNMLLGLPIIQIPLEDQLEDQPLSGNSQDP